VLDELQECLAGGARHGVHGRPPVGRDRCRRLGRGEQNRAHDLLEVAMGKIVI